LLDLARHPRLVTLREGLNKTILVEGNLRLAFGEYVRWDGSEQRA
jgi:hypothetical protein